MGSLSMHWCQGVGSLFTHRDAAVGRYWVGLSSNPDVVNYLAIGLQEILYKSSCNVSTCLQETQ